MWARDDYKMCRCVTQIMLLWFLKYSNSRIILILNRSPIVCYVKNGSWSLRFNFYLFYLFIIIHTIGIYSLCTWGLLSERNSLSWNEEFFWKCFWVWTNLPWHIFYHSSKVIELLVVSLTLPEFYLFKFLIFWG